MARSRRRWWASSLNAVIFLGTLAIGIVTGVVLEIADEIEDQLTGRPPVSRPLDRDPKRRGPGRRFGPTTREADRLEQQRGVLLPFHPVVNECRCDVAPSGQGSDASTELRT